MNEELGRRLPVSIESEQAVLGSILIRPDSFEEIAGLLDSEDFSLDEHKKIYATMRSMFLSSRNIDTVTLVNTLVQDGVYSESGGVEYIKTLSFSVPTAANVRDYARAVKDKAMLRRLILACDSIEETAYGEQGTAEQIIDSAEQTIFEIAEKRSSKELRHIRDVAQTVYQDLTELSEHPNEVRGVQTGYSGIDQVLVQLGYGDFIIVGARPGMGKTSFAVNIATSVAKATKKTVCIFSLEMSSEQLVNRMLASEARVDSTTLRRGNLSPDDWVRLADAAAELSSCEILLDDTTQITVTDMKAKLRRVKNLGLVVVDYLQLMQSGKNTDSRVQEVSDISRNLKLMAKELGVPIVCCAQLSRNPESKGRGSKRPMLSDLRDSGAIEQDADIILFLYRDDYYGTEEKDGQVAETDASKIEVIIAKNRHGGVGTVPMHFDKAYTRFYSIDKTMGDAPPA
ncbi:MAG: replicative DNA helicase [Clostridia bacterium]|nr:replicative DNA helicase [Clostridia bacterium]